MGLLDDMVSGYVDAQLWTHHDEFRPSCDCHQGNPQDACHYSMLDERFDASDLDSSYVSALREEFSELLQVHPLAVRMWVSRYGATDFGHNYLLNRERVGAGFWDRGAGELGDYLADIARHAGSASHLWDNGSGVLVAA
ncbi:hypothetical protein [Nocardia sp. NPDC050435]|uniref:hypothetical protein n=1 Tax=Nocardia sp. NPDC050435 TaxID=3155040 RepID=UPI0033F50DE1